MLNVSLVVAVLTFLSYILLLQLVLRRSSVESLRRAFITFLFSMTLWSLSAAMARLDPPHTREWMIFGQVGNTLGLPLATFNLVQRFTGREHSRYWWVVGLIGLVAAAVAIAMGTIGSATLTQDGLIEVSYLSPMYVLGAYWILFLGMSARDLAIAYNHAIDPVLRNRLRYPLIAVGLIFFGALTNGLPALRRLPVDVTANWLSALLLAYAILRYRLLDVGLAFRIGLSFASVVLILVSGYALSVFLVVNAGPQRPLAILVLAVLGAYLLLRFVPGLQLSVQLRVDQILFPERYDAQALLVEMGRAGQELRPISELAALVLERIGTFMRIRYGALLSPGPVDGKFYSVAVRGDPPGVNGLALRSDHPLVLHLQETQRGVASHQIPGLPQLKAMWSIEKQQLEALRCDYFQPVMREGRLIGLFALGPKGRAEAYSLADQRLLETLAGQLAVVIENARLYEAVQTQFRQLQQTFGELQELDRLKDEFVQNVSHELRTPLTFVKGYVELLVEGMLGPPLPEEQVAALRVVLQRTDAVIRLVNDILSFQSAGQGHFAKDPVSMAKIVRVATDAARAEAEKRSLTLEVSIAPDEHLVLGDEGRLGQVIDNLVGNALKFSHAGGTIELRVYSDSEQVTTEVEDHGIGIPAEKLDKIWNRFYQVDGSSTRRYGGTGLGLSIVRRIVEAHSGTVEVISQVDVGSCFTIRLPRLHQDALRLAFQATGTEEANPEK